MELLDTAACICYRGELVSGEPRSGLVMCGFVYSLPFALEVLPVFNGAVEAKVTHCTEEGRLVAACGGVAAVHGVATAVCSWVHRCLGCVW